MVRSSSCSPMAARILSAHNGHFEAMDCWMYGPKSVSVCSRLKFELGWSISLLEGRADPKSC